METGSGLREEKFLVQIGRAICSRVAAKGGIARPPPQDLEVDSIRAAAISSGEPIGLPLRFGRSAPDFPEQS